MGSYGWTLAQHTSNMKFLVVAACVAVCSCAPQHLVSHANGAVVPADTPAVAAAKAAFQNAGGAVLSAPAVGRGGGGGGYGGYAGAGGPALAPAPAPSLSGT